MRTRIRIAALVAAVMAACVMPCSADLLGTTVTGTLNFSGLPANYFDAANGFVPTMGYGNSSDTSVTIADPDVEFGAGFPANTDTADFNATQLVLSDMVISASRNTPFSMTFTDAAFVGLGLTIISDSFVNGGTTATLDDDTLTVSWNGGVVSPGTLQAIYDLELATPEPSSWLLLLAAAPLLEWIRRYGGLQK
ncbi:MAG TPA: hypothetical protein VFA65_23960 [Bryobacteraceae bacterium]|nr:hypothetical protein [Bryobacteraceae bacterium]